MKDMGCNTFLQDVEGIIGKGFPNNTWNAGHRMLGWASAIVGNLGRSPFGCWPEVIEGAIRLVGLAVEAALIEAVALQLVLILKPFAIPSHGKHEAPTASSMKGLSNQALPLRIWRPCPALVVSLRVGCFPRKRPLKLQTKTSPFIVMVSLHKSASSLLMQPLGNASSRSWLVATLAALNKLLIKTT